MDGWIGRLVGRWMLRGRAGAIQAPLSFLSPPPSLSFVPIIRYELYHHHTPFSVSGADDSALGSLLELSWKGTREVGPLPDGSTRKFLKDGDK
jgi:hypothetical protein